MSLDFKLFGAICSHFYPNWLINPKFLCKFATEILKIEGMCKYNIAIDDAVMEEVRPSITSGMDEDAWVQLQVEALFSRMAASRRKVTFDDEYMTNLINLSAPAWEGVKDADEWIHDLRGE